MPLQKHFYKVDVLLPLRAGGSGVPFQVALGVLALSFFMMAVKNGRPLMD